MRFSFRRITSGRISIRRLRHCCRDNLTVQVVPGRRVAKRPPSSEQSGT
jgi:hypothetical protein